eukprot:3323174-Amphidinium_carterae.1
MALYEVTVKTEKVASDAADADREVLGLFTGCASSGNSGIGSSTLPSDGIDGRVLISDCSGRCANVGKREGVPGNRGLGVTGSRLVDTGSGTNSTASASVPTGTLNNSGGSTGMSPA